MRSIMGAKELGHSDRYYVRTRVKSIRDRYEEKIVQIRADIFLLQKYDLEGTNVEHWVEYYKAKWALEPIQLLPEEPVLRERVETTRGQDMFGRNMPREKVFTEVLLSVKPSSAIPELLNLQTSAYTSNPPSLKYERGRIVVDTGEQNQQRVEAEIRNAKQKVESINNDVLQGNASLPPKIEEYVRNRMDVLRAREKTFKDLAAAIGAKLELTPEADRALHDPPRLKDTIAQLRRPQPKTEAVPRLKPVEFETILSVINGHGASFERTPSTLKSLGEEDIRNLLLAALNASFDLGAVGEAFSNHGKTDIYLEVPDGGLFIAEAKQWDGPKTIEDATDQILGYLTWRDAYGVVLIFSQRKDFSRVREQFPAVISQLSSVRGNAVTFDEHRWSSRHSLPGDDYDTVEIHYLCYNIYAGD